MIVDKKNKEIGSFLELQFASGKELYQDSKDIIRLNSGRAAIWHALRVLQSDTIWIPYYQCDTVRAFLKKKNVNMKFYHIDNFFNPIDLYPVGEDAVLFVNYFGIMSFSRMEKTVKKYNNVIIDNSQSLFSMPVFNTQNVYSTRKFVGVSDGAYVIGTGAEKYIDEYEQCFSSDTSVFLLQRIEYGCEGKTYDSRMINEHRIDTEDIMKMSKLTRTILDGTDYEFIKMKRRENFELTHLLLGEINKINPVMYYDSSCVPMVYPLVVENDLLIEKLLKEKHFQGHWWSYLLDEVEESCFEYWISRYIIPITIDQRYGQKDIQAICEIIRKEEKND